ncbi:MAG: SBBP repeat-containing protein [Flavobacteriales bacterium]
MKKILFTILVTIFSYYIQAQNFEWAKSIGGTAQDHGSSVVIDDSGNIYITGKFEGTVDFDPGIGIYNLTSNGVYSDVFITKLDASGNFEWAKNIGGSSFDVGHSIDVDIYGNVYTTGSFIGTVDFDPGVGVFNLSGTGTATFISKLDPTGNFIWAKSIASGEGYDVTIDAVGNVYTIGYFRGTVDFDPGAGIFNITSTSLFGDEDVFISKLDSVGNFVWAKNMGGSSDDRGVSIDVDILGNIYTTGYFNGTADFDPGVGVSNITSSGARDIFISKLDSAGNFVWVKSIGGTLHDQGFSLVADPMGNVYTTGLFQGVVDFDPGVGTFNLVSSGVREIFISKLDTVGNFLWAKKIGGTGYDDAQSITLDDIGNVYTTGGFEGTVDFDPGTSTFNLTASGSQDIYISKLDASGNFIWANNMGGTGSDIGNSISIDLNGGVYICGYFSGITDFDPGINTYNLTSAGSEDVFIQKLSQCNSLANYTYINNGSGNYTFTNTSSGNFNKSHWAFGDGTISILTSSNHTFTNNGTFIVVLTINDSTLGTSCYNYFLDTITVTGVTNPLQCNAGFVMYPDTSTGNITVINSSTGSNLTYLWNFGDGNTSTLQHPNHTYSTAGPFYLCLTVDDGNSCIDTYCDSIGSNGVVFKQNGFTINVISPPIITGVKNVEKIISEITIYPNPTSNQLIIDSEQKINEISIIDITGKTLRVYTTSLNSINVSDLPSGIYFIKLITNENTMTKKLIKE